MTLEKDFQKAVVKLSQNRFFALYQKPRRLYWRKFISGIFYGLGSTLGATVVLAFVFYLLSRISWLPLVGGFIKNLTPFLPQS